MHHWTLAPFLILQRVAVTRSLRRRCLDHRSIRRRQPRSPSSDSTFERPRKLYSAANHSLTPQRLLPLPAVVIAPPTATCVGFFGGHLLEPRETCKTQKPICFGSSFPEERRKRLFRSPIARTIGRVHFR